VKEGTLGPVAPETLDVIRNALRARCDEFEELARRTAVRVWRDWHAAYPLPPKQHGAILESDIVARLAALRCKLYGKRALAAYERQDAGDLFVLCVDSLVGWKCKCARVPKLDAIDVGLIVTRADFAWTLGTSEKWQRGSLYAGPVFVTPDTLFLDGEMRVATWDGGSLLWPTE
jgi:hypothetical protein